MYYTKKGFLFVMILFLSFPHPVDAETKETVVQQMREKKITLRVKNGSIRNILTEIEKQSGIGFALDNSKVESDLRNITVTVKDATMEEALNEVLKNTNYTYRIVEGHIVIVPVPVRPQAAPGQRVDNTLTGRVVDEKNQPLWGATVRLKDSQKIVLTDTDGRYSWPLSETGDVFSLVFGFVGMETKEVRYTGQPTINVTLREVESLLDDVVVTGYQRIRKSEMVGSVSTIKREDLFYDGTNTIEQMLQGKLPGTVVMNVDGLVGTRQKVRVRGTSTLLSNPEPVWVVDGIIQDDPIPFNVQDLGNMSGDNFDMIKNFIGNGIAWLNPNDIEDITVLKDASATVLYGVKAANGVIVITTKRGKAGSGISVNYSGGISFSDKLSYKKMNLMNSKERIDVSREMYEDRILGYRATDVVGYENALRRYLDKEISYFQFNDEVKKLETMNTDWMDILYHTPLNQTHSVSLSGGSERVNYYSSLNYNRTQGIAIGNGSESYGASVRLSARITDKLNIDARLSGNSSSGDAFYQVDPFTYAIQTSRAIPAYDNAGKLFYYPKSSSLMYNVLNELDETGNSNQQRSINTSVNLNYTFTPGIRFESTFGLNAGNSVGESYASENSYYISNIRGYNFGEYAFGSDAYRESALPHGGELNSTESHSTSLTWRNGLTFNQVFGKHRIGALVGQEMRSALTKSLSATAYGYFPDRGKTISFPDPIIDDGKGTVVANRLFRSMQPQIIDRKSNTLSFYGSATYSFDERYVITGSLRTDASNRFGQDKKNRFLPVWSTGIRWNVHNEAWMRDLNVLSELNIRATYGWQGNVAENIGPDLIAEIPLGEVVHPVTKEYQLKIKSLPYADLRWEKTKTVNLGVDIGVIKNRFTATFEYYVKNTDDMIIYKVLPVAYGTSSMPVNGGKMKNQGVELSLNGTLIRSKDITWSLGLNTAKNINRIETALTPYNNWQTAVSGQYYKEGYAVSSFWVFEFKGLNPETGYPLFEIPTKAENPKIVDDATEYMKYAGTLEPDFTGGLSTVFRYKTFSLSSSFNVSLGGKRFLNKLFGGRGNTTMGIFQLPSPYYNLSREYVNRWRKPGDEKFTDIPRIPSTDAPQIPDPATIDGPLQDVRSFYSYELYDNSDVRVVDASFFRCNNLSLAYNFKEKVLQYLRVKNLSVNVAVGNPFIIVSKEYKGIDPEVASGNQPMTRTYSLGLNVSF